MNTFSYSKAITGQAVGCAAALALQTHATSHALNVQTLQRALLQAGAWLPNFSNEG